VGADKTSILNAREYFSELQTLRPERKEDLDRGKNLREKFLHDNPFANESND
jgi:hypothetical protein